MKDCCKKPILEGMLKAIQEQQGKYLSLTYSQIS